MILVLRISGRANNKTKDDETMNRLKLTRKFSCVLIEDNDEIKKGMVLAVKDHLAYGRVKEDFVKLLNQKRPAVNGVHYLHPPIGGFKKSSKVAAPKGILGRHEDITKLVGRML